MDTKTLNAATAAVDATFTASRKVAIIHERRRGTPSEYGMNCQICLRMNEVFPHWNTVDAPFNMTGADDKSMLEKIQGCLGPNLGPVSFNGPRVVKGTDVKMSVDIRSGWGTFAVFVTWHLRVPGPKDIPNMETAWAHIEKMMSRPDPAMSLEDLVEVLARDLIRSKASEHLVKLDDALAKHLAQQMGKAAMQKAKTQIDFNARRDALYDELTTAAEAGLKAILDGLNGDYTTSDGTVIPAAVMARAKELALKDPVIVRPAFAPGLPNTNDG